jgi:two-component system, cell cycle response regulator CpdR
MIAVNIGEGRRVLVADDDAATLGLVSHALERLGFTVTRADDGDELLQQVVEHGPFDLLVTDVSMPWMTGLQVAHSLRAAGVETPVIVMTALAVVPPAMAKLGSSARLLRKPFRLRQLFTAVEELVTVENHA